MKRMSLLVIVATLPVMFGVMVGHARAETRPVTLAPVSAPAAAQPIVLASAEVTPEGTSLMILDPEPTQALRWNANCGFHYGKCNMGAEKRGFRVWTQGFSGFDPAQGRPNYVRHDRF